MESTKNEHFNQLLTKINKKHASQCDMSDVEAKWALAKRELIEHKIIFMAVETILLEMDSKVLNMEVSEKEKNAWEAVKKLFVVSKVSESCFKDEQNHFLEVNPQILKATINFPKTDIETGKQQLLNNLDEKLKMMCIKLLEYHDFPKEYSPNNKIAQARSKQLGDIVEAEKNELNELVERLKSIKKENPNITNKYFEELQSCSNILLKLIKKYSIHLLPIKNKIITQRHFAKLETMLTKLRSLTLDLKLKTYTDKKMKNLTEISSKLSEKQEIAKQELVMIEHQLKIFQNLGKEFEAIASEYKDVKSNIEKQNWTIQEIQNKT